MKPSYRPLWLASGLIILPLVVLVVKAPTMVSGLLREAAKEACQTCEVKWSKTKVGFFPPAVELKDFMITWGETRTTRVEASIQSIRASVIPSSLFSETIRFSGVFIQSPDVRVVEGDHSLPRAPRSLKKETRSFPIQEIRVEDGDFLYQRNHSEGKAIVSGRVRLHDIQAKGFPIQGEKSVKVELKATLEQSGKLALQIHFPDFDKRLPVDISLLLNAFDLTESNAYFKPMEGLELSGRLLQGSSQVLLEENHLKAWVRAQYHGLNLKFLDTKDRSALSAALSTLISRKDIQSDKPDLSGPRPRQAIALTRRPDETHLSFIFRGLKQGALLEVKK